MVDTKVPLSSICHNYNLYITLRCETVSERVRHRLTAAPTLHWPTPRACALIRKSGHGQQSVVPLAALAPQPPARRAGPSPLAPMLSGMPLSEIKQEAK